MYTLFVDSSDDVFVLIKYWFEFSLRGRAKQVFLSVQCSAYSDSKCSSTLEGFFFLPFIFFFNEITFLEKSIHLSNTETL